MIYITTPFKKLVFVCLPYSFNVPIPQIVTVTIFRDKIWADSGTKPAKRPYAGVHGSGFATLKLY